MLYLLIVAAVVILDLKIKKYVEDNRERGEQKEILNGKIILKKQYNRGMFMNFMEDKKETVKKISGILLGLLLLLFAIMLPKKGNKLYKLGLSLCLGGAISNTYDRFHHGYVIDYFSFNCKKLKDIVFNLADIFIILGSVIITLASLFNKGNESCIDEIIE